MLGRLEAAFEHERRFVADASHELRTPLALLRTELELALRRPRSASELERAVRSAAEETERLSQLAEDLLLIARSDQGRLPIRRTHVPAADVLEAVAQRFARRAKDHGQAVVVEPGELELDADPVRVEQALANLVDNALAHDAGSVRLSTRPESTGSSSCTSRTTASGSRRASWPTLSTGSRGPTRRAAEGARVLASRLST